MRETKDQTIARLEKIIGEQKTELSELKKERKRLNYAVERLEKQVKVLPKENSIKIKELEEQIKVLKLTIEQKDEEIAKMEKNHNQMIKNKDSKYKRLKIEHQNAREIVKTEYDGYVWKTLKEIINYRKCKPINKHNIYRYEQGDKYYSDVRNGGEEKIPIFSTTDLFIQIHPKTGNPLTPLHFEILKEWAYLNMDYGQFFYQYEEWLNKPNVYIPEETKVGSAYIVGKKLLPYYEHLLF